MPEPHVYSVEVLWNQGSSNPYWSRPMELDDYAEYEKITSRRYAEQVMKEMIEDGHAPEAIRVVAITAVEG